MILSNTWDDKCNHPIYYNSSNNLYHRYNNFAQIKRCKNQKSLPWQLSSPVGMFHCSPAIYQLANLCILLHSCAPLHAELGAINVGVFRKHNFCLPPGCSVTRDSLPESHGLRQGVIGQVRVGRSLNTEISTSKYEQRITHWKACHSMLYADLQYLRDLQ